ncbi:CapA family protein [Pseudobdellovibrio exovorus]|uniref:Capsule synthesis protein CapA domain-containing protein n=1 Tax=Pseudobdellovibrio exovorus JSS TaxID=1184267 RepID=M4VRI9_9BACT|nr:CapA family protein [Pseudobdellovibrio exovorus]AGH95799.1 hypothetical protein A11Q_1583 [Pseudobdellovibrio exovorus JSS]
MKHFNIKIVMLSIFFTTMVSANSAWADEVPAPEAGTLTLSAVGDIMMGTTYPDNWLPADQGRSFFAQAARYIKASDVRFGNFEGTFFEGPPQSDGKAPGPNRYLFKTPVDYVERLVEADFNVMSLANNHAHDFGSAGLQSTKDVLKLAGIQYSSKQGEVAQFDVRGARVALIAVDYRTGPRSILNAGPILNEITELKKRYDVVMVSAHVGAEGRGAERVSDENEIFLGENRGNSVRFARQAIDAGADVLIMHGPHVPRGIEVYRERVVLYSLGNFATARGVSVSGIAALAPLVRVQVATDGRFLKGQVFSFIQVRDQGTLLDPQKRALKMIEELSQKDFAGSAPRFSETGGFVR